MVGLGNPGPDYVFTRHNIGFWALDALSPSTDWQKKFSGDIQHTTLSGVPCLLLKPMTFMNLSGDSVAEAMRFYKLTPSNVIVFHDDIDLLPGKVKVKQGGGHGGHNGLKSIDACIGKDYWRVRLGVGRPEVKSENQNQVSNYVLGNFSKSDKTWLEPLLQTILSEFKLMLTGKETEFQSVISRKTKELLADKNK